MIPVKLAMRNFMCYRGSVPPLHFTGIHLACLSGDNGNGKSALIDAITWALWGEARAKSADDLIYTGQPEMEVEFEFEVGSQSYRIIRKRSRPRRLGAAGRSLLELQQADGDGFKPITGDSIDQTQRKITETILHMDYPTFINSAYLRQGHADEFTQQPPARRKEVLSNILGISQYEGLEARAKETARRYQAERELLESAIGAITEELAKKPEYQSEMEQAQAELAQIESALKGKEDALKKLRQQKEVMEKDRAQLEHLEQSLKDDSSNLRHWEEQLGQHRSRLQEFDRLISQRSAIEEGYARFSAARKLNEELDRRFRRSVSLERQRSQMENKIKEAGQSLNTEHALTQRNISQLEARSQRLPEIKQQLAQLNAQLRELAGQEEALRQKKQEAQHLQAQLSTLQSDSARLEREIKEAREKLDLLSHQSGARCPLCETELAAEGLKLIQSKYAAEERSKSELLKSNKEEIAAGKARAEALNAEIARSEAQLGQQQAALQGRIGGLEKEAAESEEAARQLAGEREKLNAIEQRLALRDFAAAEQEALQQIEDEIARLAYDEGQHKQAQQQAAELEQYSQLNQKLTEAINGVDQAKTALAQAEEAAEKLRQGIEADTRKRQELAARLTALPQLLSELEKMEAENRVLAGQQKLAQERMGGVKARLQRCDELETSKRDKEKQISQAAEQEGIYRELMKAFGKEGIPATLIDMALPEIEAEANRLLGRMTDNRMHVKFETQRPKKTGGGAAETLDINIADELGTRPYEMFSGGEAFRINFAIRIALSRLLARRAGTPLRTLIIDEGFGTQDNSGLEKLKEAINSIQDDFAKIIVITHIEELRDAFPTRIDVVKTAEGSTVTVS